jgi:polar amino acid transport system substrate-binding protein
VAPEHAVVARERAFSTLTYADLETPMLHALRLALALTFIGTAASAQDSGEAQAVAPSGSLRVAIGVGPAQSEFWATRDPASGDLQGVTVELAKLAAARLGLPLQLVPFANSGEIAGAAGTGAWDLSFMPADLERAKLVDQGPAYVVYISAYLLRPGSDIKGIADVDRAEHRVGCIDGTSTSRTLARVLKYATLTCFSGADQAATMLREGKIDALAMGRGAASQLQKAIPGSRLLDEAVQTTNVVVVVPKGHPEVGAWAARMLEDAKVDGTVRRVLDQCGFSQSIVAPPAR